MDFFFCKYKFTDKCIDKENVDCDKCKLKSCDTCENSWSGNTCNQCKFSK